VDADLLCEFKIPNATRVVYDNNLAMHYHFLVEEIGQLIVISSVMIELKSKLKRDFYSHDTPVQKRGRHPARWFFY